MLNNIVFGKYFPRDSIIHNLHPFVKLISTLLLVLSLVFIRSWILLLLFILLLVGVVYLSKIPIKLYTNNILKLKSFLIALIIINTIFSGNLFEGIFVVIKITMMITISSVLLFTTSVSEMLIGLNMLFSPLQLIHISTTKLVYSLSLALRFIPILSEQADKILKSQYSRGLYMKDLKWKERINVLKSIVFPMFSLSFRRADFLAEAMEVRLFSLSNKRTNYRGRKMLKKDILVIIVSIILFVLIIIFEQLIMMKILKKY